MKFGLYNIPVVFKIFPLLTCINLLNNINTTQIVTILNLCIQFVMSNILNLIENFIDIINNKCCLIMCAKYYNCNMNDAHTICPGDIVSHPAKVIWPTTFFLKKKSIFVWLLCQPSAVQLGIQLMKCI